MKLRSIIISVLLSLASFSAFANPANLNEASAETLAKVMKGVGPSRAMAIVQYRTTHGPFKSVDDLLKVKGIGEKTLELNRSMIAVMLETTEGS